MLIGELKKKLEDYSDDIEIYATPIAWIPTVGDQPSSPERNLNFLEKHKIEIFKVMEAIPAPGFKGPTMISAFIGYKEKIERNLELELERELDNQEFDFIQLADLPQHSAEDLDWRKTHRIGVAEYSAETLEIKLHVYPNSSTYNIDLERDDSLVDWLRHLDGKTWATSDVLGDLVKCWFRLDV